MKTQNLKARRTNDSTFDKIYAYYINSKKYTLTEKQNKLKDRWLAAFTLRKKFNSKTECVNILVEMYKISHVQAYIDIKNSEKLFGIIMKADRDGSLAILLEYSHAFLKMAIDAKDLKAIGKALELMGKYSDIDKENAINYNPDKLENNPIKMTIDKKVKEALLDHLVKGSLNLNNLVVTDYEEIEDAKN